MSPLSFINSDLKQKADQLMDELWSGGVNIPTTSIEQISYLMFLKSLTEMDEKHAELARKAGGKHKIIFSNSWAKYSWRTVSRLSGDELYNTLVEVFEKFQELPKLSEMGKILFRQAHLKIYSRPTLKSVVSIIDGMDYNNPQKYDTDVKGDLYEYLLSKINTSGTNGQFRTPRHIIDFMVRLIDPKPGDYILDPACGTAGFLIQTYKHILEKNTSKEELKLGHKTGDKLRPAQHNFLKEQALNGYDNDGEMIKFAIMNLYLHGLESANVRHFDPLCWQNDKDRKYDIILANPPFSGSIKKEAILEDINLNTTATELLFVKYMADHLSPNGKAVIVVPEGLLSGLTKVHLKLRKILVEEFNILGVIGMPAGVFKPYASVKTAIIVFSKARPQKQIWFYELSADGFSQDVTRFPISENDIPDLLAQWNNRDTSGYRDRPGKHGWVYIENIVKMNYDLVPRLHLCKLNLKHKYKIKSISELCILTKGKTPAAKADPGEYPLVTTAEEFKNSSSYQFEGEAVCIPLVSSTGHGHASINRLTYINGKFAAATIIVVLQVKDRSELLTQFLYYFLESYKDELLVPLMKGAANVSLSLEKISSVRIPVPSIKEQMGMVSKLEKIEQGIHSTKKRFIDLCKEKEEGIENFKSIFCNR
jgi:type I restriction-modification system DNA methylase subunit